MAGLPTYKPPRYGSAASERARDPNEAKRIIKNVRGDIRRSRRRNRNRAIKTRPRVQPVSLAELARRQVTPAYASQQKIIDNLLAREKEDATGRAAYMQEVYANFAKFLQAFGPQLQGIYNAAADRISGYAQGSSAALGTQEGVSAQGVADVVARAGGTAGQAPPNFDAAGKLYALTGYLPAATVAGQGAAWAAHGAGLPGIYAQKGIQDIAGMLAESTKRSRDISDKRLEIEAEMSGDILKQLNLLRTTQQTQRENNRRFREQQRQFNVSTRERRRQYNLDLKFRRDVARHENLLDNKKYDLSVMELEQRIAEEVARAAEAERKGDQADYRNATSRLQYWRGLKKDAIAQRNAARAQATSDWNAGLITKRTWARRVGIKNWRTYPNKKKIRRTGSTGNDKPGNASGIP